MGTTLRLLPFDGDAASFTVLTVERRTHLHAAIAALLSHDVPETFFSFLSHTTGAPTAGVTIEDGHGAPLKYLRAADLIVFASHPDVQDSAVNRAVWAYLAALPDDQRVAVFWD